MADPAAVRAGKVERDAAHTGEERQPAPALTLRTNFRPPNEIAFGDAADKLFGGIDHRQTTDMMRQHDFDRVDNGRIHTDRNHLVRHNLVRKHQ